MIIVLVVLGLVAGLVISRGPVRSPTVSLRAAATAIVQGLRATRAAAIARDAPESLTLVADANAYRAGPANPRALPAGVAASIRIGPRPGTAIRFMPDGSSSGGSVLLATPTRRMEVAVNWLSGRITTAELPPPPP